MWKRFAGAILMCVLAWAGSARADVPRAAETAYHAGNYERAVALCNADGSAAALAFAARSIIADAITRPAGFCETCLRQAIATADQAIARDASLVEGYLQKLVAIGFRGRVIGVSQARTEGLADEVRHLLDRAMELDPGNVWARASLGAWHLEIVHHAGSVLASVMYGASEAEGLRLFRKALADDPDNALLQMNFALSLLAMDDDDMIPEARRALQATIATNSPDFLVRHAQAQARQLVDALDRGDRETVDRLVMMFQGRTSR